MGMFGDIGAGIGATFGGHRSAKGFKKAEDMWQAFDIDAEEAADRIDPNAKYRKKYGKELRGLMTDPDSYKETAAHEIATKYGLKHTARQQAASGFGTGLGSSGNAATALTQYSSDMAMRGYGDMLDRLTNLGSAGQAAGIAGGQMYGDMMTTRMEGITGTKIGKYNALAGADVAGHSTIGNVADMAVSFASDARLKKNVRRIGKDGPLNKYKWEWNAKAEEAFGLKGEDTGYIAQEVVKVMPEAVTTMKGYMAIDYGYLSELRRSAA